MDIDQSRWNIVIDHYFVTAVLSLVTLENDRARQVSCIDNITMSK